MFQLQSSTDSSLIKHDVSQSEREYKKAQETSNAVIVRPPSVARRKGFFDHMLDTEKVDLTSAIITSMKFPNDFSGPRKPYKGFLLFGATGIEKSHIAEAVAREAAGIHFLYVLQSDILSKNKVTQLFEKARTEKPCIIFIDDIECLASIRIDDGDICDAKTELLHQLGSVLGISDGLFVMAAARRPQDVDPVFLRWFDKLIYVSLPQEQQKLLGIESAKTLAAKTERFTQADIHITCNSVKFSSIPGLLENNPAQRCGNPAAAKLAYNDVLQAIQETNHFERSEETKKLEKFDVENGFGGIENRVEPGVSFFESCSYFCCGSFAQIFI